LSHDLLVSLQKVPAAKINEHLKRHRGFWLTPQKSSDTTQIPCGSELAREYGLSVTFMLDAPTLSRASPLPHWISCGK
jgi:hypothetical protein